MLVEIPRPVRCRSIGTTASTQLQWTLEMPEFDGGSRECGERVDDESTPITGVVITLVGVGMLLDGTVDADLVGNSLLFPPRA